MYPSSHRLVIVDADGTLIDAFVAIEAAFGRHGMDIGDLERFQKRRHLFKYLGGLREFPSNLARHFRKGTRKALLATLTDIYRDEARLYPGMARLLADLLAAPDIRVGMVTRNVTREPELTLVRLFARHDLDLSRFDFLRYIPLGETKDIYFKEARERLGVNPARAYACGDEHKDYLAALAAGIYPMILETAVGKRPVGPQPSPQALPQRGRGCFSPLLLGEGRVRVPGKAWLGVSGFGFQPTALSRMIVSYGFESHARLTRKYAIPEENIARTPALFAAGLRHTLGLPEHAPGDTPRALE